MEPHDITLTFDDNGNITAVVGGIAGPGCSDASKWLDDLGNVVEDGNTPDYYTTPVARLIGLDAGTGGDW